jgi:hypothetical protein
MSPDRRLRVLFFVGGPSFYLRQFSSLVSELTRRGHEVHLALQRAKGDLPPSARPGPGVTYGFAPERPAPSGWRSVAWLVRGLADLARYAHPRYQRAPLLRRRMEAKILGHLQKAQEFEPLGRSLALRLGRRLARSSDAGLSARVIRQAARLEEAIPASRTIVRYLEERAPDVVLATPVVNRASTQVDFLKAARHRRIPAATCVASWDNLTNKGLLKFCPERVFVWNEIQRREASELHGIPSDHVVATGAQLFDEWFERSPSVPREEFMRRIGLDPARPFVLYTCSNPAMTDTPESGFVRAWVEALRAAENDRLRDVGIVVRPHPNDEGRWRDFDAERYENVVVWPAAGALPVTDATRAGFFDSLAYSAAVVGINTTAMIEAAIVGRSVLTVLAPEFAQESTLHFDYLLEENGGFLHVANSLADHADQLGRVLGQSAADDARRKRFVETFVRPHGPDRSATAILADEVERLATLPVKRATSASALLLRVPLSLEAALIRLALLRRAPETAGRRPSARLRRARRSIVARARRAGVTISRTEG